MLCVDDELQAIGNRCIAGCKLRYFDNQDYFLDIWEVQRRQLETGFKWLPPPWSDENLKWRWVDLDYNRHPWAKGPWNVAAESESPPISFPPTLKVTLNPWFVHRPESCDEQGWQYALGFCMPNNFWSSTSGLNFCRRRLWRCKLRRCDVEELEAEEFAKQQKSHQLQVQEDFCKEDHEVETPGLDFCKQDHKIETLGLDFCKKDHKVETPGSRVSTEDESVCRAAKAYLLLHQISLVKTNVIHAQQKSGFVHISSQSQTATQEMTNAIFLCEQLVCTALGELGNGNIMEFDMVLSFAEKQAKKVEHCASTALEACQNL